MKIDGYYVPDELANPAQEAANRTGKVQHIGLCYNRTRTRDAQGVLSTRPFFADTRVGRFCAWEYGPAYDELKRMPNVAVILWIAPRRAA